MKKFIAALAGIGVVVAGVLLYNQPEISLTGATEAANASAPVQAPRYVREALMAPPTKAAAESPSQDRSPASMERTIVPVPADLKFQKPARKGLRSPLSVLETLKTSDGPTLADGGKFRTLIVRTGFKYPLVRVEERLAADGSPLAMREMVADHVLVQLQPGQTQQDLEGVLSRQGFTSYVRRAAATPGLFLVAFDGMDLYAMDRVIKTLESERHVISISEPDLIVHTN